MLARLASVIVVVLALSLASAAAPVSAGQPEDCGQSYVVQSGDTLSSIAVQLDTTVDAILACNPDIEDPNLIFPGQVLAIPGHDASGISTLEPISKLDSEDLPGTYVPPALEPAPSSLISPGLGPQQLRADALRWLETMFAAAAGEGHTLGLNSGYRSYEEQEETFQFWVDQLGEEQAELVSARPGHSEHQLGTTADITGPTNGYQVTEDFGDTPEGLWLAANAPEYGFALSYPEGKSEVTGYLYEPWHWRYVGIPHALGWLDSGMTLVGYLRSLESRINGDADCDADADAQDALAVLRERVGLGSPACAANGDADCTGERNAADALAILTHVAALPPIEQNGPCFEVGELI